MYDLCVVSVVVDKNKMTVFIDAMTKPNENDDPYSLKKSFIYVSMILFLITCVVYTSTPIMVYKKHKVFETSPVS